MSNQVQELGKDSKQAKEESKAKAAIVVEEVSGKEAKPREAMAKKATPESLLREKKSLEEYLQFVVNKRTPDNVYFDVIAPILAYWQVCEQLGEPQRNYLELLRVSIGLLIKKPFATVLTKAKEIKQVKAGHLMHYMVKEDTGEYIHVPFGDTFSGYHEEFADSILKLFAIIQQVHPLTVGAGRPSNQRAVWKEIMLQLCTQLSFMLDYFAYTAASAKEANVAGSKYARVYSNFDGYRKELAIIAPNKEATVTHSDSASRKY